MKDLTRTRLVAAGVAALGLALGFGVGAATGSVASPDTTLPPPPTTTTSTTVPQAVRGFPDGDPIEAPTAPPVAAIGMPDGAFVVLGDIPDDRLVALEAGRAVERRLTTPGSIVEIGDAAVALGSSDGVMVVPHDGSAPLQVETARPIGWHADGLVAWLAPGQGASGTRVLAIDLDEKEPEVFVLAGSSIDVDRLQLVAADRGGAVLAVADPAVGSTFVIGRDAVGQPPPLPPGEAFVALLPGRVATTTDDGTIGYRDRGTLEIVDGPAPPTDPAADGVPCAPVAGAGEGVLWTCPSGALVATSGTTSVTFPAERAELVDDGRFVVWFVDEESLDDASVVRVTDLVEGSTGSLRSPGLPILRVRP